MLLILICIIYNVYVLHILTKYIGIVLSMTSCPIFNVIRTANEHLWDIFSSIKAIRDLGHSKLNCSQCTLQASLLLLTTIISISGIVLFRRMRLGSIMEGSFNFSGQVPLSASFGDRHCSSMWLVQHIPMY